MISNQIKYKWQNNNIEITENILWSMTGDSGDCVSLLTNCNTSKKFSSVFVV